MVERKPENVTLSIFGADHSYKLLNMTIIESALVNNPPVHEVGFLSLLLLMVLSILLVNIMSIMLIMKRESTLVNSLLTLDCIANAILTVINSIQEYKIVGLELYCAPVTVIYSRCFVDKLNCLCNCNNPNQNQKDTTQFG